MEVKSYINECWEMEGFTVLQEARENILFRGVTCSDFNSKAGLLLSR